VVHLEVHRARVSEADSVTMVTFSVCSDAGLKIADHDRILHILQNLDHDLLGPLTVIIGYSDSLLRMESLAPLETTWLQEIRAAGRKLTARCRRLIKAAHVAGRAIDLKPQPVLLKDACDSALRGIVASHGQHKFDVDIPSSLSPVAADPRELPGVISEILLDVIRCAPHVGKIRITASPNTDLTRNVVSISGQGTENNLGHTDLEPTPLDGVIGHETGETGSGLGLYIARSLLEMMGGVAWTEKSGGGRRNVMFSLPIYRLCEPGTECGNTDE